MGLSKLLCGGAMSERVRLFTGGSVLDVLCVCSSVLYASGNR